MSDPQDNPTVAIPAMDLSRERPAVVGVWADITRISSASNVIYELDRGTVRLYLGDLSVELPPDVWRPIVAALTEVLNQIPEDAS